MKKLLEVLKSFFGGIGADFAIDKLSDTLEGALEKFYAKDPAKCTALIQSFYAWIPTLEELAAESKTNIDDKAVAEAKADFEKFAAAKGIELPAASAPVETQGDDNPPKGGEHPQDPPPNP